MTTKLELTWVGKNSPEYEIANIEPRLLEENPALSNCLNDPQTENMLIHGDNLLALKALLPEYEGKIKCIYIDPPYNTGNAFEHYDDSVDNSVEHSLWLSLIKPRMELLRMLLSDDGVIFISIDDRECHYIKILCDEIYGRNNFVANIVWQKKYGPAHDAKWISDTHDHILVYAFNKQIWRPNLIERTVTQLKDYKNPDNDHRGVWRASDLSVRTYNENCTYKIIGPTGKIFLPPPSRSWGVSQEKFHELNNDNRIWWGKKKDARPMVKKFLTEVKDGITTETWWNRDFAADNKIAKYESKLIFTGKSFSTPKPELLLNKIIHISSNPGDLVLDSFLGSGTTAAVAHKMGRRYIGIEMGEHAYTHCKVRLDKVIDGTDQGGISKAVGWQGGGAYKFYELAPSFIVRDEHGNPVIDGYYNDVKLIKAMCKLLNFVYQSAKESEYYWKQGSGQGNNYLFVTTQLLTSAMVRQIAQQLKEGETLTICPKNYEPGAEKADSRVSVKKIPQSVLKACHFGKKEYLLPIKEDKAIRELAMEADDV